MNIYIYIATYLGSISNLNMTYDAGEDVVDYAESDWVGGIYLNISMNGYVFKCDNA